jgi:hypothetical protein
MRRPTRREHRHVLREYRSGEISAHELRLVAVAPGPLRLKPLKPELIIVNATRRRFGSNNSTCCGVITQKQRDELRKSEVIHT